MEKILQAAHGAQAATALQTWHQGSIFTKLADGQEGSHLMCPHCGQAATAVNLHRLWFCKETNKSYTALPEEDKFELEHGINLEFWAQRLVQLPRHQLSICLLRQSRQFRQLDGA